MEIRKIPYGYMMQGGIYIINEEEGPIIKYIFTSFIGGKTVTEISNELYSKKLPYFDVSKTKAREKVYMILGHDYYCNEDKYPALISTELFTTAKKLLDDSTKHIKHDIDSVIRSCFYCEQCGRPLIHSRRYTDRRWHCTTKGCPNHTSDIPSAIFADALYTIIRNVVADPSLLDTQTVISRYTPDMVVKRKENDILMRCHIKPLNYDRIRKGIFELASEKYDLCSYDRTNARTSEIKRILSATGPDELPGINDIRKILRKVTADHLANIKAEFINGKVIEFRKEQ